MRYIIQFCESDEFTVKIIDEIKSNDLSELLLRISQLIIFKYKEECENKLRQTWYEARGMKEDDIPF